MNSNMHTNIAEALNNSFKNRDFVAKDALGRNLQEIFGSNITFTPGTEEKEPSQYLRGDVVFVSAEAFSDYNCVKDKDRPAIVIQNNLGNYHSPNLIVLYLTTQVKNKNMPTHVLLKDSGCIKLSVAQAELIQTLKKDCCTYIGKINPNEMDLIDTAIIASLGLEQAIEKRVKNAVKGYRQITASDANVPMPKPTLAVKPIAEKVPTKEEAKITLGNLLKIANLKGKDCNYSIDDEKGFIIKKDRSRIAFQDVEGIKHLIEELQEFVQYLEA